MLEFADNILALEKYILENGFITQIGERLYVANSCFYLCYEKTFIYVETGERLEFTPNNVYLTYSTVDDDKATIFLDIKDKIILFKKSEK